MNVDELMNLDRPLTDEEVTFMEQELLKLTEQLGAEITRITKDLDPNDPLVAKLRAAPASIADNVEKAIACKDAPNSREADVVYSWEKLPVYAWNNEFARVIGRLLVVLPPPLRIHAHNLAGQATLISNCIAMTHREVAPGEVVPKEEVRAYLIIGTQATHTTMKLLAELSKFAKVGRRDIAHGMELIGMICTQFETELADFDRPRSNMPSVVH